MNYQLLIQYLPKLWQGLLTTLELMAVSAVIGLSLALLLTTFSIIGRWHTRKLIDSFIFLIRGTPLLVQLFIIYYGTGQFAWLRESPLWLYFKHPFACAVLAFGLNTAAYTTELFRGAIQAIPYGEIEACQALGMSKSLMLRRILLPRALQLALPAYSNEIIMIIKCTTLASTITLLDLTGMVRLINAETYATLEFFMVAGIIYLLLNAVIMGVFKKLEQNFKIHRN